MSVCSARILPAYVYFTNTLPPRTYRIFSLVKSLQQPDSRLKNESQTVIVVPNVFQDPCKPLNHFEKRFASESKSEFREINFGIFIKEFKDVRTSLVNSYEIFTSNF